MNEGSIWRKFTLGILITLSCVSSSCFAAQIKTYQDFENSFLYKELFFKVVKSNPEYRIYRDSNNNYIVALQIDSKGEITTERIIPIPKVPSKSQNGGMVFFVLDFVFGDGKALKDISATHELQPHLPQMETGFELRGFKVRVFQDPWKIRAGMEVARKSAPPWSLKFDQPGKTVPMDRSAFGTTTKESGLEKINQLRDQIASANEAQDLEHELQLYEKALPIVHKFANAKSISEWERGKKLVLNEKKKRERFRREELSAEQEANTKLTQITESKDKVREALFQAKEAYSTGELATAERLYQVAIEETQKHPEEKAALANYTSMLGQVQYSEGKYADCLQSMRAASKIIEKYPEANSEATSYTIQIYTRKAMDRVR